MKTDTLPPTSSFRLLALCGFAACWLGAAVTGLQASARDVPAAAVQADPGPGTAGDLAHRSPAGPPQSAALRASARTELWR